MRNQIIDEVYILGTTLTFMAIMIRSTTIHTIMGLITHIGDIIRIMVDIMVTTLTTVIDIIIDQVGGIMEVRTPWVGIEIIIHHIIRPIEVEM